MTSRRDREEVDKNKRFVRNMRSLLAILFLVRCIASDPSPPIFNFPFDAYITIPTLINIPIENSPRTWMLWIYKYPDFVSDLTLIDISGPCSTPDSIGESLFIVTNSSGESLGFLGFSPNCKVNFASSLSFDWDTWVHLAMTWSGSQLTVYKNGIGANVPIRFSNNTAITTLDTGSYSMQIGRRITNATSSRVDFIDDIRIWGRELSQNEIITEMTNLSPVASGCVAYWDGSSMNDVISGNQGTPSGAYTIFNGPCLSSNGICNGHGVCTASQCSCYVNWNGTECDTFTGPNTIGEITTSYVILSTGKVTSGPITSSVMTTATDLESSNGLDRIEIGLIAGTSTGVVVVGVIAAFVIVWNQKVKKERTEVELPEVESPPLASKSYTKAIPSNLIKVKYSIGSGNFGEVYVGDYKISESSEIQVALKKLHDDAATAEFEKESDALGVIADGRCANIVRFYGMFTSPEGSKYIVLEYMNKGSLLSHVRSKEGSALTQDQLLDILIQCANGLKFLESNKVIHRDIAARNVLLGDDSSSKSQFVAKISDFGMARQNDYYYKPTHQVKIPVRWSAPETFDRAIFTNKSDVYSFGVTMWETFTFGNNPWVGLSNPEVAEKILNGEHLEKPSACPEAVYKLMVKCWSLDAEARPTFEELHQELKISAKLSE